MDINKKKTFAPLEQTVTKPKEETHFAKRRKIDGDSGNIKKKKKDSFSFSSKDSIPEYPSAAFKHKPVEGKNSESLSEQTDLLIKEFASAVGLKDEPYPANKPLSPEQKAKLEKQLARTIDDF